MCEVAGLIGFPNPQALCRAIANEAVPRSVSRAPVLAGTDSAQRLWFRPDAPFSDDACFRLRELGAEFDPPPELALDALTCWHQLLPLERSNGMYRTDDGVAVLFELAAHDWPKLTGEIFRLTPGPHPFRWQADSDGERIFLITHDPPVYSLLRAEEGNESGVRAYVEQAPQVWVRIGWRHPLAAQIEPPTDHLLLIGPPHAWQSLADTFEEALSDFSLPPASVRLADTRADIRLSVPLRLVPREPVESAELWILRDQALEQLALLAQKTDDTSLASLNFAVGVEQGREVVLVRMTGVRQAPTLSLPAEAYHSHLKLSNLFLPCARRLQPPLRRDVVRRLLAADPERIAWLSPNADGSFSVESLPAAAFGPLREVIDYLAPRRPALGAWQPAALFDLEKFTAAVSKEPTHAELRRALAPDLEAPKALPQPRLMQRVLAWWRGAPVGPASTLPSRSSTESKPSVADPGVPRPDAISKAVQVFLQNAATLHSAPPAGDELQRHQVLERKFIGISGPPDAPERLALWPELAGAYQGMGNFADAGLCWLNALWETRAPVPIWLLAWFRAAARAASWRDGDAALDRILASEQVEPADVTAVAGYITWAMSGEALPSETRRGQLRLFLETHEATLPVRAAWLAWLALGTTTADVLSLARARDRLLEHLFRRGLSVEQDLPTFLRCTDPQAPHRAQAVRDWLTNLRGQVHDWIAGLHGNDRPPESPNTLVTEHYLAQSPPFVRMRDVGELTRAYADLLLAWGLARLGDPGGSQRLIDEARAALGTQDQVHAFLLAAFRFRIRQALEGSAGGSLPAQLLERLQKLDPVRQRYKVDWLRRQSRILEPDEKIDPYRGDVLIHYFEDVHRQIAALSDVADRAELAGRLKTLLSEAGTSASLPPVLTAGLELAPRIGEDFALELLNRVMPALEALDRDEQQTPLLERALFVAAHFDQAEFVQAFVARFAQMLDVRRGDGAGAVAAFESLAAQSFRGLRKLGMRDEVDRLQRDMADRLLQGQSVRALRDRLGTNQPAVWRTLLQVAAGWFYAGNEEQATAVLDEVREVLFADTLEPRDQTSLARAYAGALGSAPLVTALERIAEIFARLRGVQDRLSAGSHFSLAQLDVIEAVVLAVANDDFALGTTVRRWLDEDEFLVRRRIHRDLRSLLMQTDM